MAREEKLIRDGLIGAAIGALLSDDVEDGALIGALVGVAISATRKANKRARKTNRPVLIVENEELFRVYPSGKRVFVKRIPSSARTWPTKFKLR